MTPTRHNYRRPTRRPSNGAILARLFCITAGLALVALLIISANKPSCYPLTDHSPALCR